MISMVAARKHISLVLHLAMLMLALSVTAAVMIRESATSEATFFVSPSSIDVRVNQTFEVSVNVSGVSDLYGWEFKLGYNTSLLEMVKVTEGSFLNSSRDTYFVPKNMSTDGYVLAGCTSLRNVTGVSGNGTLATVEFRTKTVGSCTVDLYDTRLVNSARQLIGHNELDGTVTVVDITSPAIEILSPQNLTYCSSLVPLTFTVYDYSPISWIGYSLDSQSNITITGNTIISVEDGAHGIVVYANDTFGNMGSSQTIYFSVDTVSPTVMVSSPQNTTYASASVPLTFAVSEPASWMGYSLDGQANVTISGNTTLAGLSNGSHSIVVYVVDAAGNMSSSAIISFVVDAASPNGGGGGRMPYMN